MSANDLVIFEFEGRGERETSIDLAALEVIARLFAEIVVASSSRELKSVRFRVVAARQGSLRIDLRPIIRFTREHSGEMAAYASILALAVSVLQLSGVGQPVEPAERQLTIQIELDKSLERQCFELRSAVRDADIGALTIYVPDGNAARIEDDQSRRPPWTIWQFSGLSTQEASGITDRALLYDEIHLTGFGKEAGGAIVIITFKGGVSLPRAKEILARIAPPGRVAEYRP